MKKLASLYIFLILSIICYALYIYSPTPHMIREVAFSVGLHKILESIATVLLFLISFKQSIYIQHSMT